MLSQRALEAFKTVLESGSVSGAAEIMNVSQPAVSRLIRDLEDRTGLQLFTRFGGKIVPTPEARELAVEVERSFVGLATIEKTATEIRQGRRSTVAVAAMPALAHSLLPDALVDLLVKRPNFRVQLLSMQTHNVVRQVASRQSQLGFTSPTRHEHDIDLVRTVELEYVCILPPEHPLGAKDRLRLEDFAGQSVVGYSENTATGAFLQREFGKMVNAPEVIVQSHLSTLVSALVLRGLGVSLVDPFTARSHEAQGGLARPFETDARFRLAIIRPRGMSLGPDLEALLEVFDAQVARYSG
ncbi:LysR family transcriptional regulator [Salipiger sp. CCB-MM3]|uniref:LysR substrate-binding domain-containing protein n=1 Tax=Roseobacteraceae TaxID=2854170 RepID=UPI00080AAA4B|nr:MULTISPECIES: LysR substrate-binding domain-containing protein [Roseobacteraceae]ANT60859.1 LysR family transcriptional regulator [Salipiger sp. CCB-MM3]MCA0998180.1 LysR family transcriptional regulator [Alloyangia pacifica]